MKAIKIKKFADVPLLEITDLEVPKIESEQIRVSVKAAGINQADILQAKGKYPAPANYPQDIPGLEFAGIITELGEKVNKFAVGDRVFGLIAGGAFVEELVIHHQCVTKIPQHLSFIEAAALPEVFITAYDALISQTKLAMGESLLINAVGSGVGVAALQIAKNMGVTTFGTSRSQEKLEKAHQLGLDYSICCKDGKFSQAIKNLLPSGVDVILELVGGDYLSEDIECIASKGRIIVVGLLGGRSTNVDLSKILSKRLTITGTTLRARPLAEKIIANQILENNLLPLLNSAKIKPVIDEIFPLKEVNSAFNYLASSKHFGKIVLEFDLS